MPGDIGEDQSSDASSVEEAPTAAAPVAAAAVAATVASAFAEFRAAYPAAPARPVLNTNPDQFVSMAASADLKQLVIAPEPACVRSEIPRSRETTGVSTYLWAVGVGDVPYALERCEFGLGLQSGVIKHTNLTANANAHCAGEMWFVDGESLILNGGSGRYGPSTFEQLEQAGLAFKASGYKVALTTMDEHGLTSRIVVGEPKWL